MYTLRLTKLPVITDNYQNFWRSTIGDNMMQDFRYIGYSKLDPPSLIIYLKNIALSILKIIRTSTLSLTLTY